MPFHRSQLAREMADQLLRPRGLDTELAAGMFLSGPRRIGKTTFMRQDLIPVLQEQGAIVVYADLWAQPQANPAELVGAAVRQTLKELETPASALFARVAAQVKRVSQLDVGAGGFKFAFKVDQVGAVSGPTLAQVFTDLVDNTKSNVILVIDEIQHALGSAMGNDMLFALKAARDAVNLRPESPGRLFIIGTGSHRAQVQAMVIRGNQAFQGAVSRLFPLLGQDYVAYVLEQTRAQLKTRVPTLPVAVQAFQELGSRPEELHKALTALRDSPSDIAADLQLPIIARALRGAAADVEVSRVQGLGDLAVAVFNRICLGDQPVSGFYTAETYKALTAEIGVPVTQSAVQNALLALADENLIMALGKGAYDATDPFVKKAWREEHGLAAALGLTDASDA
jgi:hypothetical protein